MLYDSMDTLDTETDSKRGFIILSRKVCALEKTMDSLDDIRFPMLPSIDIYDAYQIYLTRRSTSASLKSLLDFCSSEQRMSTILFTYLFQVNDWYGSDA